MADPRKVLELRVPARASELKGVRAQLREALSGVGCGPDCADEIVLAVDEACQNIIRHAYGDASEGDILLWVEHEGDRLVLWLRDFAPRVDTEQIAPRDLDDIRPGGLGVHLIQQLMDECGFVPQTSVGGNLFRMAKQLR